MKEVTGSQTQFKEDLSRFTNLIEFELGGNTYYYNDGNVVLNHNSQEYQNLGFTFSDILSQLEMSSKSTTISLPNANNDLSFMMDLNYINKSVKVTKLIYGSGTVEMFPVDHPTDTSPYLDLDNVKYEVSSIVLFDGYLNSINDGVNNITLDCSVNIDNLERSLFNDRYDVFNNPQILKASALVDFKPPYLRER